jgi:hypothetical protein
MHTKTREEVEIWVVCLKFLSEQKNKEQETATSTRSASYFYTLTNTMALNQEGSAKEGEAGENDKKKKNTGKSHKFSNIDARAFVSVI